MRWFQFTWLALTMTMAAPQAWSALACWAPFHKKFEQIRILDLLLRSQNPDHYLTHKEKTIFYSGQVSAEGMMLFRLPHGLMKLNTKYEAKAGTDTPYGDLRNSIYILGPELAALMGWEIKVLDPQLGLNGPLIVHVPGAKLYEKRILQINEELIANHKEPISIIPRRAGFLNSRQMLRFSLETPEHVEISFPNQDQDADLSPHEAGYHLNFIFPQELSRRARNINTLISTFVEMLRRTGNSDLSEYADAIEEGRSLEMDAGSALSTVFLARSRSERDFSKPQSAIHKSHPTENLDKLAHQINTFSRPTLTAFEVLVQHLIMSDPSFKDYLRRVEPLWTDNLMDLNIYPNGKPRGLLSQSVSLVRADDAHQKLYLLLKEYKEAQKTQIRPSLAPRREPSFWAAKINEIVQERANEIAAALRQVLEREAKPE